MTTIPLTPSESALAREGKLTELVRPVEPPISTWAAYGPRKRGDIWEWLGENPEGSARFADSVERTCPLGRPGDVVRLEYRFSPIVDESSYKSWQYTLTTLTVRQNGNDWEWVAGLEQP